MTERGGFPSAGAMTDITGLRRYNMRGIFSRRRGAIVTSGTGSRCYTCVIKGCGLPSSRAMARVTR